MSKSTLHNVYFTPRRSQIRTVALLNNQKSKTMSTANFTTTLLVNQTPEAAFNAINNPRGWWSEAIEGDTDQLGDEFVYQYKDIHYSKLKIVEWVPNKKVVWLVLDNFFKFTVDKSEWKGTKIIFDISQSGNQTLIRFTHEGLVPQYECYEVCQDAWTRYIADSLRSLIATGTGQPNSKEDKQDYRISITVDATAQDAFDSINNVSQWWTENLEGHSHKLNDEFTVRFDDVHVSTQKLIELIPAKKVVWLVTASNLNFVSNRGEWTGTKISFDISSQDGKTQITFTHYGLVPGIECYGACSGAWGPYIKESLRNLVLTTKSIDSATPVF